MSWEQVGGVSAIIGVFYLYYQFHYLPKVELNEVKNNLLALFNTSSNLINNLIIDLKEYVQSNNQDDYFSSAITFGSYIMYLENMRDKELSPEMYKTLLTTKFSRDNISLMINNLEKQITSLNNSQTYFDTAFKYRTNRETT